MTGFIVSWRRSGMAQRLNDATNRTPMADGETIGRNGTVGNSDWKLLGQSAERKEWGGTVRPVARKGQGVSGVVKTNPKRQRGRTLHAPHIL